MSGAADIGKCNSFAMEKMKAKAEEDRLEKMHTKQKAGTPTRDINLQQRVFQWLMLILDEMPKGKQDYDKWIQDGKIITKAIQCVKFNSVPIDPTTGNNFKNQAALTKNKENQKNNNSFENRNFSDHTDKQNGRTESKMNGDRNGISMNGGDLLKRYRYTPEVLESLARKEIEDRVKLLLYHLRRLGIPENFLFAQDDLIELKNVPKVTRCIATLAKMSGAKLFENCTIDIPEELDDEDDDETYELEDI